jgi:PAS domain S-box-containing protein
VAHSGCAQANAPWVQVAGTGGGRMTGHFGLSARIALVFVAFAFVLQIIMGSLSYRSGRDALEAAAISELLSSALEKEFQIDRLVTRQKGQVEIIGASPALLGMLAERRGAPASAAAAAAELRIKAELMPYIVQEPSEFMTLAIADPDSGALLASSAADLTGTSVAKEEFFKQAKNGFHLEPPHLSPRVKAAVTVMSTPLRDPAGKLLGVLIAWIDLDSMGQIVRQRSGMHHSDDVYLVSPDFKFVTQPRFAAKSVVLADAPHTEAVKRCLAGNSGVIFGLDYRAVPSITVYRWLPKHKLGLITKISEQEASLLVRDFRNGVVVFGVLVLLASLAVAVWLARSVTQPVLALRHAALRLGHGEFDVALPTSSRDELGELAREFKQMAEAVIDKEAQLRANALDLEQRVLDRTQALQRQAGLLDLAHDAIIVRNAFGTIEYWNHGAEEVYGWTSVEAVGRDIGVLLKTSDAAAQDEIEQTLRVHSRWEGRLLQTRRDGRRLVVASRQAMHFDEHSQSTVTLSINSDITEHTLAEQELNRFFHLSLDLLCIASHEGYFLRLNPAWESALGYTVAELMARPYIEFIHPDDHGSTAEVERSNAHGIPTHSFENRYRCKDGSYRWLSWQAASEPAPGRVYAVAHDVTERKQAEQDLKQAKDVAVAATRAKSAFLANMSHEIRTPMNGVLGMIALAMKTSLTEQQRQYMSLIKTSADSLRRLINDILDFSKMEEGKLELEAIAFDLRESLGYTLQTFTAEASEKGIALSYHVAPDVPAWFIGDPGRLAQVIINLVGNALKFTEHGEVVLRVVREAQDGDTALIAFSVADTGIGITPEQQTYVFNEFAQADNSTTRQYGGTGLGLAIVAQLVALMGGAVRVESEAGHGATFHFTLRLAVARPVPQAPVPVPISVAATPALIEQARAADDAVAPATPSIPAPSVPEPWQMAAPARLLRVLVAEDHPVNQTLVSELLRLRGHSYALASNGKEALDLFESASFDVILMDGQMPVMDGYQASREIRKREQASGAARIRIIALTANAMKQDRELCLDAGMDEYIAKPIEPDQLLTLLESEAAPPEAPPAPPTAQRYASFDIDAARRRTRGKEALLREMVQVYHKDLPRVLASLTLALEQQDATGVERDAHRLKGAAATLSAAALVEAAQELEISARKNDFDIMQLALSTLRARAAELGADLATYLDEGSTR